jgi:hypothetical protein
MTGRVTPALYSWPTRSVVARGCDIDYRTVPLPKGTGGSRQTKVGNVGAGSGPATRFRAAS